jgi:predicted acylesterase/phospholipase RssA
MRYLVLGPGALAFYALLGYVSKHKDELEDVEEISGASAGAILGFLLLSKKTPQEIFDATINLNTEELTKVDLKTFINSFGFINHELIKQKLIELWGGNPTFKELPKKLYVSAYCLNTLEVEYFSRDTHPDMYVVDAVCASMSIPIMFTPYEIAGKKYIDGCTTEDLPVFPFLHKNFSDLLCVKITQEPRNVKLDNMLDYLMCIATTSYKNRRTYDNVPIKRLDVTPIDVLNLRGPLEDRLKLFMMGYEA